MKGLISLGSIVFFSKRLDIFVRAFCRSVSL